MSQLVSEGYQVARQLLSRDDVQSLQNAITETIDAVAKALRAPFHTSCPDASFEERLDLVAARDRVYAAALLRAALADAHRDPRIEALASHPSLAELVTDLLQPLRWSGQVIRLRALVPAFTPARSPWHQDVIRDTATGCHAARFMLWIPLSDVSEQMGALELVPGSWRAPINHREDDDMRLFIPEEQLPVSAGQAVPLTRGDVLILDRFTPHRSSPVRGNRACWAVVMWIKGKRRPSHQAGRLLNARRARATTRHQTKRL